MSVARTRNRYVALFVSDWLIEVDVADPSVCVDHEPPLTWRCNWFEEIPSASQADHAFFTRTVVVPSVVLP